jgi:hypothetical protein
MQRRQAHPEVSQGQVVGKLPARPRRTGRRCRGHGAGQPRSGAAGRGRGRRGPRLSARRRGHERRRMVAVVGPRGRGVLAGHARRGDRSGGSRSRDARRRQRRDEARSHAHDGAVAALPVRRPRGQAARRAHPRLPCVGLRADRDAVAAVLASFIVFGESGFASSARVDYAAVADALPAVRTAISIPSSGWQDTLSESTGLCAREGSFLSWRTPTPDVVAVARRTVGTAPCPTLDEIGSGQTTPERARRRTNMSGKYDRRSYLRDTS